MNTGKVLVTGAAGFTGRHFIDNANSKGLTCIALTHDGKTVENAEQTVQCDLLDIKSLEETLSRVQPDYIVHLAAIAFVAHGSVEDIYSTNICGTTNLLDATLATTPNVKKILVASSANIYGNTTKLPISEQQLPAPENDYGVSKLAMEYAVKLRMNKLPIVISRPFNYTGTGQAPHFLIPKIVSAFKNDLQVLELGNTDVARDFSDVRDICEAYSRLLLSSAQSNTFNVCSGQATSLLQIINKLESFSKRKMAIEIGRAHV